MTPPRGRHVGLWPAAAPGGGKAEQTDLPATVRSATSAPLPLDGADRAVAVGPAQTEQATTACAWSAAIVEIAASDSDPFGLFCLVIISR